MERPAESRSPTTADLTGAIEKLWARFLPEMHERVSVLAAAAAAVTEKKLSAEQRKVAQSAAHKLAGALGTFNLTRGTVVAREMEMIFSQEGGPDPKAGRRLAEAARELRTMIENRKANI
jgi:HPt (histidine-containing phosphotransfer) domain-containing protein